jgi:hypothetical protein
MEPGVYRIVSLSTGTALATIISLFPDSPLYVSPTDKHNLQLESWRVMRGEQQDSFKMVDKASGRRITHEQDEEVSDLFIK